MPPVDIRTDEAFPQLKHSPIWEAAFELRGRADENWNEATVRAAVAARLIDYQTPDVEKDAPSTVPYVGKFYTSTGLQLRNPRIGLFSNSQDWFRVVQLEMNRFLLSGMQPYPGWGAFRNEVMRSWDFHQAFAKISRPSRISLRYVNRIPMDPSSNLSAYLLDTPEPPRGLQLDLSEFLHEATYSVPGHEYEVSITRTFAGSGEIETTDLKLVIDIEVSRNSPVALDECPLAHQLEQMRWLKNKAFFGTITDDLLEKLL